MTMSFSHLALENVYVNVIIFSIILWDDGASTGVTSNMGMPPEVMGNRYDPGVSWATWACPRR